MNTQIEITSKTHQFYMKKALEQALPVGRTMPDYLAALDQQGYQVTATNESLSTHAELEIVKGQQTFELQIERDVTTGRAVNVVVAANLWQAKETVQALR
mgnify:CR=1 FL=1